MPSRRNLCHPAHAARIELERALGLLQSGKDPQHILEALSRRLTNKLLHEPILAVRGAAKPAR